MTNSPAIRDEGRERPYDLEERTALFREPTSNHCELNWVRSMRMTFSLPSEHALAERATPEALKRQTDNVSGSLSLEKYSGVVPALLMILNQQRRLFMPTTVCVPCWT